MQIYFEPKISRLTETYTKKYNRMTSNRKIYGLKSVQNTNKNDLKFAHKK